MTEVQHNRLYRSVHDRVIAGVCGGLAEYFGFDATVLRVLVVVAALFFMPIVPVGYLILALLLKNDPSQRESSAPQPEKDEFERNIRAEPHSALGSVRHRYREIEARLQRLEKYVTSERYTLDREFERLRE